MHPEDQQLIAAFLDGDTEVVSRVREWLAQASRRFRPQLRASWEDVQQELLLEVTSLLRSETFRGDSRLRTYLWRVAQCTCLNLLRDQKRRPQDSPAETEFPELPERGPSVLRRIEEAQAVTQLQQLMSSMPADCRRLWTLILAGQSYRQMSEELGIAVGTLRVRVLRCRRKAQALWDSWSAEAQRFQQQQRSPRRRRAVK